MDRSIPYVRTDQTIDELINTAVTEAPAASAAAAPVGTPTVAVIIPCYNHAHYLGDAVASVQAQTYPHYEIIVVDDGSTDNTAEIAAQFPGVTYVWQQNQGLSAARNAGLHQSAGEYLVFLDADDRLLPRALEVGVLCMSTYPDCAFVSGHYRYINGDGSLLVEHAQNRVSHDHYLALLRGNYIGMHATVMYRREIFDRVGAYDTSLRACEDYDLYLRIARDSPIFCHDEVIAEYRQHGANMSGEPRLMLRHVLAVLRRQQLAIQGNAARLRAYQHGVRAWQAYYGRHFFAQAAALRAQGEQRRAAGVLWKAIGETPLYAAYHTGKWSFEVGYNLAYNLCPAGVRAWVARALYRLTSPPVGRVRLGDFGGVAPIGAGQSVPPARRIDAHYTAAFLAEQAHYVRGEVLEISDGAYAKTIGMGRVKSVTRLIPGNQAIALVDHLNTDHLPDASFDCILLLQTLHRIYDLAATVQTLHRLLKPGGVLLLTAPGVGLVKANATAAAGYWAFTERTLRLLFEPAFGAEQLQVSTHGNVLAAMAWLHGLPADQLDAAELEVQDPQYPLLLTLRAIKSGSAFRCEE